MWYEAVPSFAIIGVSLFMPQILIYLTNQIAYGTPYKRLLISRDDSFHYLRDARLSGVMNSYKQFGLENLPLDEDEKAALKSKQTK